MPTVRPQGRDDHSQSTKSPSEPQSGLGRRPCPRGGGRGHGGSRLHRGTGSCGDQSGPETPATPSDWGKGRYGDGPSPLAEMGSKGPWPPGLGPTHGRAPKPLGGIAPAVSYECKAIKRSTARACRSDWCLAFRLKPYLRRLPVLGLVLVCVGPLIHRNVGAGLHHTGAAANAHWW